MVPEQKPQYNPWLQSIFLETGLINLCGSSTAAWRWPLKDGECFKTSTVRVLGSWSHKRIFQMQLVH